MKKENVKVLICSKKEAKDAARLLRVMGEKADKKYFEMGAFNSSYLIYDEPDNDWILLTTPNKEVNHEITLKQLVRLLSEPAPSMLSGECAIHVNNEREFKLLMEYYHSKGWTWNGGGKADVSYIPKLPTNMGYEDEFCHSCGDDKKIIPFADFAKEVGIEYQESIEIDYSDSCKATITWDAVKFTRNCVSAWVISQEDIQPIYDAWKSLQ